MDRLDILRQGIAKAHLGIEIGPYFAPLVPKRAGYNSLSLDVFGAAELRRRAKADPGIPRSALSRIETVDLVGSASDIAGLARARGLCERVDYIVSSHNFEHLPDPIRFLQGCAEVLRPGGVVAMAIPDRRCTFDYFRPHSVTGDLLAAYFEARERPTPAQLFVGRSLEARFDGEGGDGLTFTLSDDPARIAAPDTLAAAYAGWQAQRATPDAEYRDAHCWAFTPASLELILRDLNFLGLVGFEIDAVQGPLGCEFFVRLRKPAGAASADRDYPATRAALLHRINADAAVNALVPDAGDRLPVLRSQVAALQARAAALDGELQAMRRSRAWRLTAPLRRVARALRRRR